MENQTKIINPDIPVPYKLGYSFWNGGYFGTFGNCLGCPKAILYKEDAGQARASGAQKRQSQITNYLGN